LADNRDDTRGGAGYGFRRLAEDEMAPLVRAVFEP